MSAHRHAHTHVSEHEQPCTHHRHGTLNQDPDLNVRTAVNMQNTQAKKCTGKHDANTARETEVSEEYVEACPTETRILKGCDA